MSESFPVIPGAEAWSSPGAGELARIGILLVHGFTGNPRSLRPLGEALAKRGFALELPRLPGHGTHYKDLVTTRYADWFAEAKRALGILRDRAERVLVVGFSMGGFLGLDLTSSNLGVAALVTINAQILDREGILPKLGPYLERIVPVVPASAIGLRKDDIARPGQTEQAYDKVPAAAGNSFVKELPRVRAQIPEIQVPVLVAYAPQDHSVAPANSQALIGLLKTEVTELLLERSYHVAPLDYDFDLLVERIAEFAARLR